MFSGIIKELGEINNLSFSDGLLELTILSKEIIKEISIGDSISINGCCQTVVEFNKNTFKVQATQETLEKTNFKELKIGSKVNLESSLKFNSSIDGHLVSGHIDTVGEISNIEKSEDNTLIEVVYPEQISKYIAPKGSIAVNGVSLTVISSKTGKFTFTLIPFTRDNTNLGLINSGDLVNLEVDLLSRYLVNYIEKSKELVGSNLK